MHLKDKVILVTGGTSGIGEAATELFARHGAKVVTASIQKEAGTALAKRLTDEGIGACSIHRREQEDDAVARSGGGQVRPPDCVLQRRRVHQKITDVTLTSSTWDERQPLGPVLIAARHPVMERQARRGSFHHLGGHGDGFPAHGLYGSKAGL